jgi:hypothetical protein
VEQFLVIGVDQLLQRDHILTYRRIRGIPWRRGLTRLQEFPKLYRIIPMCHGIIPGVFYG